MLHHKKGRKLGRKTDARRALLHSLAFNLIKHSKMKTTEAKAKEVRPFVEKLITKARVGGLAERKLLIARIGEVTAKKLIDEVGPKYKERAGGYTRITKMPSRKGDAAKMAIIELV